MKNYYQILGVSHLSSAQQIKTAYRKLAMRYHPDKNPDQSSSVHIQLINEAYETLGNPEKRRLYDMQQMYLRASAATKKNPRSAHKKAPNRKPRKNQESDRKPFFYLEYFLFSVLLLAGIYGLFMSIRDWWVHGYQPSKTLSGLFFGLIFTILLSLTMWVLRQKRKP
ncbi:MAG: J domain-containing protein [Bacteroidota bacterium]